MSTLRGEIAQWSGAWSSKMTDRCLDTFTAELEHYPAESVTKALAKARRDWENLSHPTLKFVLERLAESSGQQVVPSTLEFNPRRGLELGGPAWEDPGKSEPNRKTLQDWADGEARWGRWQNLAHPQVVEVLERFGVVMPVKPDPRQGVFS